MKKAIAVMLLGSALILPNNSVEASYSEKEVLVQKVQYTHYIGWEDQQFKFYDSNVRKNVYKGDRFDWQKMMLELEKLLATAELKAKPAPTKPAPVTPEAKPAPAKPAPVTPEAKPEPAKPAPVTPEAKPEPAKPTPVTPEAKPEPTKPAPVTPEAKPVPSTPAPTTPAPTTPETNPEPTKPAESAQDASLSTIEKAVLDLTNAERQKAGLSPLQTDSKLMNSARQKSTDMATNKYFSHTSPTYGSPFDQMKANGVSYKSAAENIAMGQRTAQEVVKGWMDSPGHRQNILTAGYTHIGIGYDANGHYWTQQFIGK